MTKKKPTFFKWEYGLRTTAFALLALCANSGFAVMNCVIAVKQRSLWYGALSGYYFLLILFRGATILSAQSIKRKYGDGKESEFQRAQNKIYLGCGAFLVLVEIVMCLAVTQMTLYGQPVLDGTIYAIATAAYAFYKIIMAVWNLFKAKKYADPAIKALRNLNFADACMSMASLTVLMLSVFQENEDPTFAIAIKAFAGFAACAAVLAVATCMIVKAIKKLRESTNNNEE